MAPLSVDCCCIRAAVDLNNCGTTTTTTTTTTQPNNNFHDSSNIYQHLKEKQFLQQEFPLNLCCCAD
ncbi:MAG: hypothetical protein N6V41_00840, partial [Candidatus Portiera aleyrodidarum]|nr:hypothetical protein [Candidatus Portiera aleyrodidarum]